MAIIGTDDPMEKKRVAAQLLFIWCAVQLLAPFAVPCALECSRANVPIATATSSHSCCVKSSKLAEEFKSVPLCVCSIQSNGAARLEAENVLFSLTEKDKLRAAESDDAATSNHNTLRGLFECPPGLLVFPDSEFSGSHSILRI
jgi:hypothetical protein